MRILLIAVLVIGLAAVAGLLALPRLVDPATIGRTVAGELQRLTGRDIAIAGPVAFAVLPFPRISLGGMRIANAPGAAAPDMLRAGTVEASLALAPLLAGRIVLDSVTLVDPILDLERHPDGGGNWRLNSPASPAAGDSGQPAAITNLRITNGTILYRNDGAVRRIDGLSLTAHVATLAGPLRAEGAFRMAGQDVSLALDIDRLGDPAPFRLSLALANGKMRGELAGEVGFAAAAGFALDGKLKLTGGDLAAALAAVGVTPPRGLAHPFSATADLAATPAETALTDLQLTSAETRAVGSVRLATGARPVRVAVALALNRIDLDALAAAAPRTPPGAAAAYGLPGDLSGTLDLALDGLVWRGELVRQLHLQGVLQDGSLAITRAGALLPGGSDLALSGRLTMSAAGRPQFQGAVEGESGNLRLVLGWLGLAPAGVPADRLRNASLAGRFTADPDTVEIQSLDLTLDATRITGAARIALRQRLALGVRLALDRLNLDAYLPLVPAGADAAATMAGLGSALANLFDANLEATLDSLTWRGEPLRGVHLAGTLQQGALTIREAGFADLAGASGTLNGTWAAAGREPARWQGSFSLRGPEIAHFLRLAGAGPELTGVVSGAFGIKGDIAGDAAAALVDAAIDALGGHARVSGQAMPMAGAFDLDLEAAHPSFARVMRVLAPGYRPAGPDPGALTLVGKLKGGPARLTLQDLALAIGALSAAGEATLERGGARPKLSATLQFGDLALDTLLPARQSAALAPAPPPSIRLAQAGAALAPAAPPPWSRAPLDLAALAGFDADLRLSGNSLAYAGWRLERPEMTAQLQDARIEVRRLAGSFYGGTAEASLGVALSGEPRVTASLALRHAALKDALEQAAGFARIAGAADLDLAVATTGRSPADLVAHLAGSLRFASRDGTITGIDLPAVSRRLSQIDRASDLIELFRGLSGGATPFQSLDGSFRIAQGVATSEDLHLVAAAGDGSGRATLDLPAWTIDAHAEIRLTEHPAAPPFAIRLEGPLDAPSRIFEVNALESYLLQRGLGQFAPLPGTPPPQGQVDPENALRDLLRGLAR